MHFYYPFLKTLYNINVLTDHWFMPENLLILLVGLFSLNEDIIITIYCKCMNYFKLAWINFHQNQIIRAHSLAANNRCRIFIGWNFETAGHCSPLIFTHCIMILYVFVLVLMIKNSHLRNVSISTISAGKSHK